MTRGFAVFALWIALAMVGYERLLSVDPAEAPQPPEQEETYQGVEGGDGTPPRPCSGPGC